MAGPGVRSGVPRGSPAWEVAKALAPGPLFRWGRRLHRRRRLAQARRHGVCDFLPSTTNPRPRILFYSLHGLAYGGTEKFLQVLAKHLPKDRYDVFYAFSAKPDAPRRSYLEGTGVDLIELDFDHKGAHPPHVVEGMRPHLFDLVRDHNIDLVVAAGPGYAEYPVANLTRLPVVHINVFGWVNPQPNLTHVCISKTLGAIFREELPDRPIHVLPILSEGPDPQAPARGRALRQRLAIPDDAVVFGRIGRPSDLVFDPIGLRAFQAIATDHPNAHYVIMAPPPAAERMVAQEAIPRVHFLPPSGDERDIWAFHCAIDVLAHWRVDGETFGLNLAESLIVGNPVVTHRSRTWNAQLELAEPPFGCVAGVDDVAGYGACLRGHARPPEAAARQTMRDAARRRGQDFLIQGNLARFEKILAQALAASPAPARPRIAT